MESKLKALKVADLKDILSKANVSVPAKANKSDLVAKISASHPAIDVYNRLYPSKSVPPPAPTNDDLLAPPEDVDWTADEAPAPSKPISKINHVPSPSKQVPDTTKHTKKVAAPSTATPAPPPTAQKSATSEETEDEELKKRRQRAERFGIPLVQTTSSPAKVARPANSEHVAEDSEKLNARAKRFGTSRGKSPTATAATGQKRTAPTDVDPEEAERRRRRAERFGMPIVGAKV